MELTESQYKSLFDLVRYQRDRGQQVIFCLSQGHEPTISRWGDEERTAVTRVPRELVELWHATGYVYLSARRTGVAGGGGVDWRTLILCKEAENYERWMGRPKVLRMLLRSWKDWAPEWRAALVALVVTVVVELAKSWMGLVS